MKANELRKYNYVLYKGTIIQLIGNYDLFKACVDCERTNDYEPIPLTEEWILKFSIYTYSGIDIDNKGMFWYEDDNKFYIYSGLGDEISYGFEIEVTHVHQLQNLYFALTGEELTILKDKI